MSEAKSIEKVRCLSESKAWNINDITWILLGHEAGAKHFQDYFNQDTIPGWEHNEEYFSEEAMACYNLLEEILECFNNGRFGRLFVECMDEFETINTIHPLRVVDWINETSSLKLPQFKHHSSNIQQKILMLFETVDSKRPDKNDNAYKIDYIQLARADFWVLTELRIILFGETYHNKYNPRLYQKFTPAIEDHKRAVDKIIEDALSLGIIEERPSRSFRKPLITYVEEDGDYCDLYSGEDNYIGSYDFTELGERCTMYQSIDLLKALLRKGYPISKNLLNSFERGQFNSGATFLRELRKQMEEFFQHGPNELTGHTKTDTALLVAPEGTAWNDIGLHLSPSGKIKIKIKLKIVPRQLNVYRLS